MSNPVSRTAWYCTGVRMQDARSAHPLVGDTWAERFLDEEGRSVFARFADLAAPNGANIVRHWLIDQWLKDRIVLIGAGFDSRALRLPGGRWIEADEAPVIERKERIAPAQASPNHLVRVAIDFARESLAGKLAPHATAAPVTVVMEGVTYYLEASAIAANAKAFAGLFPRHELICDLQSNVFVERWGRRIIERIAALGAHWRFHPEDPVAAIEALGYRRRECLSIALRAAELQRIRVPAFVIRHLLPSLRDGYRLCAFERR
jgi:O-methyltransferase involved in polyketide biosynthesis